VRLSRREFAQLGIFTGAAALLGATSKVASADSPITAQQLVDKITKIMGPAWNSASYRDTFKMGDPSTPVNAVAACFMSTFDVIKRAHEKGLNFVITHEPTMWTDQDFLPPVQNDPLFKLKLEYVNDNKMIVWRTHDSWHKMLPEPMTTAQNKKLGWDKYAKPDNPRMYNFPSRPLRTVVTEVAELLPTGSVRVIGQPDFQVASLTRGGHAITANIEGTEDADMVISSEVREWETCEYGRDMIASGIKRGMVIIAHEAGEEAGMEYFTNWFKQQFPAIRIENIQTTDRLWTV
jgi:putative NIF3 family GTP cyclohydrolase 1 type 2